MIGALRGEHTIFGDEGLVPTDCPWCDEFDPTTWHLMFDFIDETESVTELYYGFERFLDNLEDV